jgi:GT2 family glycosyltransferase
MNAGISIAIPTFGRDLALVETVRALLSQRERASELILIDQTPRHDPKIEAELEKLHSIGEIRWIRLDKPSITRAMNVALLTARSDIVLFLDDDIVPQPGIVTAHLEAHRRTDAAVVAGRVIQPWELDKIAQPSLDFSFSQSEPAWLGEFMAGNVSIRRELAIRLGGFDENFVKVAYRFESEFAYRLRQQGFRIYYTPSASVRHLKASMGGTRAFGDPLRSVMPNHSVGEYYFILRTWCWPSSAIAFARRPFRAIRTRHHIRQPWWIPATIFAEVAGMVWAILLVARGSRHISRTGVDSNSSRGSLLT